MATASGPAFPQWLEIEPAHHRAMLDHLLACLPEEGCGLVGGRQDGTTARAVTVIPVPNELRSPVRFRMDPARQLAAFHHLEREGLELVAIFHSHPAGPPVPSPTDLAEFAYPGVLSLIWSPGESSGQWQARAFGIHPGQAVEAGVRLVNSPECGLPGSQPNPN